MVSIRIAAAAVVSGLAISALTAWICLHEDRPAASAPIASAQPGHAANPALAETGSALESLNTAPPPPVKVFRLSFDADGDPIPDASLRAAFDYYLLEIGGDEGLRELTGMAGGRASAAETRTLNELARKFLLYMHEYDAALAAAGLSPDSLHSARGLEACANWLVQRERLQRETLGENIASAMFGNDNLLLRDALAQMRSGAGGGDAPPEEPGGIRHPSHAAVPAANEDDAEMASSFAPALRSFTDQAIALRAWRKRYDDMLAVVGRKNRDVRAVDRTRSDANALLRDYFPSEDDRRRAAAELSRE
ncbi:MAG TPA: hypothetical protein VF798_06755 [Burkholderiaceae bacterium]